jgi:hypothetical protein
MTIGSQQAAGGLPGAGFNASPSTPTQFGPGGVPVAITSTPGNDAVFQSGADAVTGKNSNLFNVWKYPFEIGTPEVPHYVMFYATVRKSTLSSTGDTDNTANVNFDPSANNIVSSEGAAEFAVGMAGAQVGKKLGSFLGIPFQVVGFLAGAEIARNSKPIRQKLLGSTTRTLIKDVVALYLPGKPSVQYAASWADVDVGAAAQLSGNVKNTMDNLNAIGGDVTKILQLKDWGDSFSDIGTQSSKAVHNLLKGTGGATTAFILKNADTNGVLGNFGAALQASAAVVPNPFKAQLFHTMGFRTFTFDYTFLPKNKFEYDQVQKIIRIFKTYMHPTLDGDKYLMHYPAEWNIAYYYKGTTNKELFKIASCALTNCKVEYGGTDFTTFKRIPGGPTEISMQLSFVELELLTRARIAAGY